MPDRTQDGALFCERRGDGDPLLLIPGTGSRRQIWYPVIDRLESLFEVIAIDLPGCGDSPLLAGEPTIEDYTDAVATLLDELDIATAHIAGNSLGGWLALELARRGRARSVTLLSPTGMWRGSMPAWVRVLFRVSQFSGRVLRPAVPSLAHTTFGRTAFTFQAFGRPWSIEPEDIIGDVLNLIQSPGVEPLYEAARHRSFVEGQALDIPISIAFGTRDVSLPRRVHRGTDQLPAHVRSFVLRGCGHVPMYDDPDAIVRIVFETAALATTPVEHRAAQNLKTDG